MVDFKQKNLNPKGKKTGDCVIRALALALDKDYYTVYHELYMLSIKLGFIVSDKRVEEKLLLGSGFIKHKQPIKPSGRKYLVGEIDKLTKEDVVVISCAHHLTACIKGTIYDTWDCRGKCISNFYTLNSNIDS